MDKVDIKHPRQHNTGNKAVPRQFIAAGTATGDIVRVDGWVKPAGGGPRVPGRLVVWAPRGGQFHWQLLFRVSTAGFYKLIVNGYDAAGIPLDTDAVPKFEVGTRFATVTYPSPGQDITDDKDYFIAYGVPSADVTAATMTPGGGAAQPAEALNSDVLNNPPFWSAQFRPLAPTTTYQLDVTDGGTVTVPGLTVQ